MKKKVFSVILCTVMAVTLAAPFTVMAEEEAADISGKTIGYYMDAADDYYKCAYEVFMDEVAANEETADWKVQDIVGQGTSQEQLSAVEDFITAGVDAIIVVQNSPEITSECITKANEAGIPYFAMTHVPSLSVMISLTAVFMPVKTHWLTA